MKFHYLSRNKNNELPTTAIAHLSCLPNMRRYAWGAGTGIASQGWVIFPTLEIINHSWGGLRIEASSHSRNR